MDVWKRRAWNLLAWYGLFSLNLMLTILLFTAMSDGETAGAAAGPVAILVTLTIAAVRHLRRRARTHLA